MMQGPVLSTLAAAAEERRVGRASIQKPMMRLLLLLALVGCAAPREINHEDIKDAILSLVHIVRASEDKLERHELREKVLGEHLKKSLAGLEKRHKTLEPLKGLVSRLDERLSNVETILLQKDEREKQQAQKSNEMMGKFESNLQSWKDAIANMIRSEIKGIPQPVVNNNAANDMIKALDEKLTKKIDSIASAFDGIKKEINSIKDKQTKTDDCKKSNMDEAFIENLLSRFDSKLRSLEENITSLQVDIRPLDGISQADEAWHSKMTQVLENQQQSLDTIKKSLANSEAVMKSIPTHGDLNKNKNETLQAIRDMQYDIKSTTEQGMTNLQSGVSECVSAIKMETDVLQDNITNFATELELNVKPLSNLFQSLESLQTELQTIGKIDRVMIQTADNVLDNKRRIEYGVKQTVQELGTLVRTQTKELNSTLHSKFDEIHMSILDEQTGALANVSKKIETEISQVWRQIGIMHQQLMASSGVLDKLQAQTDQYVNGSATIMDNMGGKIGTITSRMTEVDENLNYLLGRLSVVTQEFNKIKRGLGDALEEIKSSFLEVKKKIKDAGPGPHYFKDSKEEEDT